MFEAEKKYLSLAQSLALLRAAEITEKSSALSRIGEIRIPGHCHTFFSPAYSAALVIPETAGERA